MRAAVLLLLVLSAGCDLLPGQAPYGEPVGPAVMLAEGEQDGVDWRYLVQPHDRGLCESVAAGGIDTGGCSTLTEGPPPGELTSSASSRTDQPTFVTGQAGENVTRVVIETRFDGSFPADVFDAPPELGLPLRFFIGVLPEGSTVVRILALDAQGKVLSELEMGL